MSGLGSVLESVRYYVSIGFKFLLTVPMDKIYTILLVESTAHSRLVKFIFLNEPKWSALLDIYVSEFKPTNLSFQLSVIIYSGEKT
jgi:hypothetical protein